MAYEAIIGAVLALATEAMKPPPPVNVPPMPQRGGASGFEPTAAKQQSAPEPVASGSTDRISTFMGNDAADAMGPSPSPSAPAPVTNAPNPSAMLAASSSGGAPPAGGGGMSSGQAANTMGNVAQMAQIGSQMGQMFQAPPPPQPAPLTPAAPYSYTPTVYRQDQRLRDIYG